MATPNSLKIETTAQEKRIRINTSRLGEIEIPEQCIIHMPSGILGFSDVRNYVLIPHKENSPFFWYQSLEEPSLAFVVMDPFVFKPDYDVPIVPQIVANLEAEKIEELDVLVIVTIPKDRPQDMTANLLGPILINRSKKLAKQIVLDPERYGTKTLILSPKNKQK